MNALALAVDCGITEHTQNYEELVTYRVEDLYTIMYLPIFILYVHVMYSKYRTLYCN